jgi:hypothetical protein
MKRLPKVWLALCVFAVLPYLLASLLRFPSARNSAKSSNSASFTQIPIKPKLINAQTQAKFQAADLTSFKIISSNGNVFIITPPGGGDPPLEIVRILAAVIKQHKKANRFVLTVHEIAGGDKLASSSSMTAKVAR